MTNHLYYGDNLQVLRDQIADQSVDLIYLDPPFNSNASYNVLFKGPKGNESAAQIEAFDDTWHWGDEAEAAFQDVRRSGNAAATTMLHAMRTFLGDNDMMAYLAMMAVRLLELHRVLKPTGSLYLHCDPTASHYLKILLDAVFGARNFRNEISWQRSTRRSSISNIFRRAHDILFFYSRTDEPAFNIQYEAHDETLLRKYNQIDGRGQYQLVPLMVSGKRNGDTGKEWRGIDPNTRGKSGMHWVTIRDKLEKYEKQGLVYWPEKGGQMPRLKYYLDQNPGIPLPDIWTDINLLNSMSGESLGYPTQKPVALIERIISASSNEGDVVLDPFCGCGTTVHAAEKLNRRWIGIDVTHLAIGLIEKRLRDAFPKVQFTTHGVPQDIGGARDMAARGKAGDRAKYFEFEKWALSLIDAQPGNMSKKGADKGIDGNIWFGKKERAIVQVKAGEHISRPMITNLRGVIEREEAEIGIFLTLTPPKKTMIAEAVAAGQFEMEGNAPVPRIQIVTVEAALELHDRAVQLPLRRSDAFKKAVMEEDKGAQGHLEL